MYSKGNSYEEILARCLSSERLQNIDKREGSIIYDTLAPLCLELAEAYIKMDVITDNTYLLTATGSNLDKRVYDYGVVRKEGTKAKRTGSFKRYLLNSSNQYVYFYVSVTANTGDYSEDANGYEYVGQGNGKYEKTGEDTYTDVGAGNGDYNHSYTYVGANHGSFVQGSKVLVDMDVPVGSRYSVPNDSTITYIFTGKETIDSQEYNILECEVVGAIGNTYTGTLLPLVQIPNLVLSQVENIVSRGEDVETDEELRERTIAYLNNIAFGGNISDYMNKVGALQGVGGVKVFPAYINENQVVLSVKATNGDPITAELLNSITTAIRGVSGVDSVGKLEFDGGVRVSVVSSDHSPLTPTEIGDIQDEVDPLTDSGNGMGIAPIGHYVSIVTPSEDAVNVTLSATYKSGADEEVEAGNIKNAIGVEIASVRTDFGRVVSNQYVVLEVVVSKIIARIMNTCPNVNSVSNVSLSSVYSVTPQTDKITYTDTAYVQYIPKLGTVTINDTPVS